MSQRPAGEAPAILRAVLTAQGQIIYASAAGTPAVLAPTTSGYVLSTQGVGVNPIFREVSSFDNLKGYDIHVIDDFTNFAEDLAGSGATVRTVSRAQAATGATASSLAVVYASVFFASDANSLDDIIDWDKAFEICFFGAWHNPGVAGNRYSWMRFANDITGGDLAAEGIGLRYNRNGYVLYSQTHDGATLESQQISSGVDLSAKVHRFRAKHTPGVDVEFFIDDVSVSTHTTIPAGTVSNGSVVSIGAENPGAAADTRVSVNRIVIQKEWN